MGAPLPEYDWKFLEKKALRVVRSCRESLPIELRKVADEVPVICRNWHPDAARLGDEAAELLGEYLSFEENKMGEANGPIVLYLGALYEYCAEKVETFEEEARLTYLHELGHHFGWDEDELSARGLE